MITIRAFGTERQVRLAENVRSRRADSASRRSAECRLRTKCANWIGGAAAFAQFEVQVTAAR